ncbi:hypothetical protein [Flavimarina sp. Hel_I_48]|uniref:hypothetical protein n=1 Tax=Flavimarina sp. Hel_I_48 TaxID=1392488 RepID=UPI000B0A6596|nr:hypothetical protein [Flavimarina sp. Hel_I_48]
MSSCRDDFESTASTGNLEFSRDTVYLDTVFTNVGSSTYTLKVYNRGNSLINIPTLGLARGEESRYRLNVDGRPGKFFNDVEILPRDSIFIFIETTLDYNTFTNDSTSLLYTDAITFDNGANEQHVELVTLVQDAVFLFPKRDANGVKETLSLGESSKGEELLVEGFLLEDDELTFTNEKPYVIYGYAAVGTEKTLTIEAGARVHFHEDSGIIVGNNGSLKVNGSQSQDTLKMENQVIFEGDRLEPLYTDVPGQWGTIWLTAGSKNNEIHNATIKNATIGVLVDSNAGNGIPTLAINNTQIYNSSNIGLLAQTATVTGENLVINNAGISALSLALGGSYTFKHATIVNYLQQGFRQAAALQISNFVPTEAGALAADLKQAKFINCVISGNRSEELQLQAVEQAAFNYTFTNCLLRFDDPFQDLTGTDLYDFGDTTKYMGVIISSDPLFKNALSNDLRIGEDSPANGTALPEAAATVPFDILGIPRTGNPDIGAYESIIFKHKM